MCDACGCAGSSDYFHVSDSVIRAVPFKQVEVQQGLLAQKRPAGCPQSLPFRRCRHLCGESDVLARRRQDEPAGGHDPSAATGAWRSPLSRAIWRPRTMRAASAPPARRRCRSPPAAPAISTRTWCMTALHTSRSSRIDLLFIENVGNLVCPASFDLGQHCDVVLLSVTEGDDKPEKYPVMFRKADLVVVTKTDLSQPSGISIRPRRSGIAQPGQRRAAAGAFRARRRRPGALARLAAGRGGGIANPAPAPRGAAA